MAASGSDFLFRPRLQAAIRADGAARSSNLKAGMGTLQCKENGGEIIGAQPAEDLLLRTRGMKSASRGVLTHSADLMDCLLKRWLKEKRRSVRHNLLRSDLPGVAT